MHNLYTLRGAKVRDAQKWSGYIDDAMQRFGDMDVVFASHHWPMWGNARVLEYLAAQRDTYKYIHDQTLRLANQGYTAPEIAEQLELPTTLRTRFANRGYYGTIRHNAKAVYQAYFGWYDGNPANLDPVPPESLGRQYVAAMGGAAAVLKQAQGGDRAGDYRWAATLLNNLVFAEPSNAEARDCWLGVRPARVPGRVRTMARRVPFRRLRTAQRRAGDGGRSAPRDRVAAQYSGRALLDLDGGARSTARRPTASTSGSTSCSRTQVKRMCVELVNSVLHHHRAEPARTSMPPCT